MHRPQPQLIQTHAEGSGGAASCSLILLAILLSTILQRPAQAQAGVVFDDSAPDRLLLRNAHYELALSKANGAILALIDRSASANLTLGSRYGCLWGAVFPGADPDYVGGCSYSGTGPHRFD